MKVTVTHLKAPWPAGAGVGSVVEVPGDAVPAWAVGKCTPAGDDAEAAFVWTPPAPPPEPEKPATADANAAVLLDSAMQEVHELKGMLAAVTAERDAALAKGAELQAAADAAAVAKKAK